MIKLANGREVTLDEFLTWGKFKQNRNLNPKWIEIEKKRKESFKDPANIAKVSKAGKAAAEKTRGKKKGPLDKELKIRLQAIQKQRCADPAVRKIMSERAKKSGQQPPQGLRGIPVMTPKGLYKGMADAAREYNSSVFYIKLWMKEQPKFFFQLK